MLGPDLEAMKFHEADSEWLRSFSLRDVKCLVVCRGPVRLEAFEVFEEIGMREYGMLLSEKDSIVYPKCSAPEIRSIPWKQNVHRVKDYMGAGREERMARIADIVRIARTHEYTHVFAGYGFMAEEAEFIQALEDAGIGFMGPSASVIRKAGAKDEAKKLARHLGNAVIPGVDNVSALALARRCTDRESLERVASERHLEWKWRNELDLEENAEALLQAGYAASVELVTIEELQQAAERESDKIWAEYPGKRIRFKCIGGGGGKGQRVVSTQSQIAGAVTEIIAEQKVGEPGSNRNFLIELNLETTRHNEIQVVGNGEWAITLGGRDCSIQMREQKQLEFSLTEELLDEAISRYRGSERETLQRDKEALAAMERDAEAFGIGVGLDSVSTFECIVDRFDHFFMEMNTRIQVEHGVTELAYRLKFTNPADPTEHFYVERLIEAMVLIGLHGRRLPRPERIPRFVSGAEIRLNATDAALQPHAGGVIRHWSDPLAFETRDDQGIGIRNPDTGSFLEYALAGAYDSNVALILGHGGSRAQNLEVLAEIVRRTELRGDDLQTSLPVQNGLINWTLGVEPMMKPNTRFLTAYLAAVGSLQEIAMDVDLDLAWQELGRRAVTREATEVLDAKKTLVLRPLRRLLRDPHALAGFIGRYGDRFWFEESGEIGFKCNPVEVLSRLYHFLHMEYCPVRPAAEVIWVDDNRILEDASGFYRGVSERTGLSEWAQLGSLFHGDRYEDVAASAPDLWAACRAAHEGHQLGMELLNIIPRIARRSGFAEITVDEQLEPVVPEKYLDADEAARLIRMLVPSPAQSSNEIVTSMGGVFYSRESPDLPPLVEEGEHFEAGQPLFVIEVMKMFNKVLAPFSGTVKKCLMLENEGGVVRKGDRIFEIEPDVVVVPESRSEIERRRRSATLDLL